MAKGLESTSTKKEQPISVYNRLVYGWSIGRELDSSESISLASAKTLWRWQADFGPALVEIKHQNIVIGRCTFI